MTDEAKQVADEIKNKLTALETGLEEAKKAAKPEDVQEAKDALDAFKTENEEQLKGFVKTTDLEELKQQIENAQLEITSLKENGTKEEEDPKKALLQVAKDNKEKIIKSLSSDSQRTHEFAVKANTFTTNIANNTNSRRLTTVSPLAYRKLSMYDAFPKDVVGADESGTITYMDWDDTTSQRAATARAEGELFPESEARFIERTIKMKKIGDSIPVSEEFGKDERRLVGEVERFIRINMELERDLQLYSGDGLNENLEGVFTSAPLFDPTTPANAAIYNGIQQANLYDLAVKTKEFISRGKKSKFNPDVVMLNMKQINDLMLLKNNDFDYLKPPFVIDSNGSMTIAGMTVIESNNVEEDTMIVGDSRYATIYTGDEYTLTTGYIADQFLRDIKQLKGRERLLLLIREADKQGFAKVTNIAASLITLAA